MSKYNTGGAMKPSISSVVGKGDVKNVDMDAYSNYGSVKVANTSDPLGQSGGPNSPKKLGAG